MRRKILSPSSLVASVTFLAAAGASAQPLPEDHLIDEQDYAQQQPPQAMPWPAPRPAQDPYGYQVGAGQPYDGQPAWAQPPIEQAEIPDDASEVDDGYDPEAYTDFQDALAPYGTWEDVPDYGYVWSPSETVVGAGFTPYGGGGHWALSDYGWTWVSDWDWGWAPFHYGRWMSLTGYGWCWIPGRTWGPAWVSWRFGGGYVGWAPLPPRGYRVAPPVGVHTAWRFSTAVEFGSTHPRLLPAASLGGVFTRTSPVLNVTTNRAGMRINAGPQVAAVSAAAGRAFVPTPVHTLAAAAPRANIVARTPSAFVPGSAPRPAWRSSTVPTRLPMPAAQPGTSSPGYRGGWNAPRNAAPSFAPRAVAPAPSYAAQGWAAPRSSYAAPSWGGARNGSPAPRYSAPAARYSAPAPRYSAPQYSAPAARTFAPAPHYSTPAPNVSAPAPHVSAPAPHYSAPPAPHVGGARFGGGGFRRR